jgi:AcrR family transcriptional regulator
MMRVTCITVPLAQVTVITCRLPAMGRWKPDAVGRLSRAALALFEEQGFEDTTVAEIAQAAGLTESTFFRTFTDKREVLFAGFPFLEQQVARVIHEAPLEAHPTEALQRAMSWLCTQYETDPVLVGQRQAIIAASAELSERELVRHAALARVMAEVLSQRGLPQANAHLLAQTAMVTIRLSLSEWLENTTGNLGQLYVSKLTALRSDLRVVTAVK